MCYGDIRNDVIARVKREEWSRGERVEVKRQVHTVLFRFPASSSLHHTHATQNYQVDGRASQHSAQMLSGQAGLKQ